jgi:hypothetical protein
MGEVTTLRQEAKSYKLIAISYKLTRRGARSPHDKKK